MRVSTEEGVGTKGWGRGRATGTCRDPQPQESSQEALLGLIPHNKVLSTLDVPQSRGSPASGEGQRAGSIRVF